MAKVVCALIAALAVAYSADVDHIKEYELVHIATDSNGQILQFSAFSVDYKIELEPNHDLIPSNIRHTNGNPTIKAGEDPYYTSQTETCHFLGKLLEPKTSTDSAIISVSMCNKHGIRADIRVNGETLIVRPSALYLDDIDKNDHSFDDEHIVYKLSSVDSNGLPFPHYHAQESLIMKNVMETVSNSRQLLQENNVMNNKVEVLLLICESLQTQYRNAYGDSEWYETLTADLSTAMNTVSTIYQETDWTYAGTNNVGSISFSIVEFEVIEYDQPGFYYSELKPEFWYSNCQDFTNPECAIDGGGWLNKITEWVRNTKKLTDTYDNIMIMHSLTLCSPNSQTGELSCVLAGQGKLGSICVWSSGWGSVSNNRLSAVSDWYKTQLAYTMTHEAGHNFNLYHDQDFDAPEFNPRCTLESGLMGYGSVNDLFSDCSKKDLNAYFAENDLSCLANEPLSIITNYGTNAVNGRPTSAPTPAVRCWRVSGAPFESLNADYERDFDIDGTVYKADITWNGADEWYLYPKWDSSWYIHNNQGGDSYFGVCWQQSLADCDDDPSNDWAFGATPCPGSATSPVPAPTPNPVTNPSPTTAAPTPAPTLSPTPAPVSSGGGDCWAIENHGYTKVLGCYCYDSLDNDGNKVYSRQDSSETVYLYNLWDFYWCVSNSIGSTSVYGYSECANDALPQCSAFTAVYGCNPNAFTEEQACYNETKYSESVCIQNDDGNVLFHNRTQWTVDETCINGEPIYYWHFTNDKTNFTQTFYLHFDVTDGLRWIVSAFRVSSVAIAFCSELNLFECLASSWTVISDSGDLSQILIQPTMAIYNGVCYESEDSEDLEGNDSENMVIWIVIACAIVFGLLLIGIMYFVCCKKQKRSKAVSFDHGTSRNYAGTSGQKVVLNDDEPEIDESYDANNTNEAEIEVEVEVEVEMR